MATSRQFLIGASVAPPHSCRHRPMPSPTRQRLWRHSPQRSEFAHAHHDRRTRGRHAAHEEGKFRDARRAFRTIVSQQRADGEYPIDALRDWHARRLR